LMSIANISGVGMSVFNDNKPVFKEAFGWANVPEKKALTTSAEFYGASLSKAVFGYIATQLMQEKAFDPDKPLVQYLEKPLPDYKIPGLKRGYDDLRNDKRYEKITGRMCLNHTTGFPNWRWFEPDKKMKIKFEPGSRYSYSGEGLYLLQFVIEQITKKDLETLAKERVFIPFNMPNTSYVWQEKFEVNPVYGHNSKGEVYEIFKWKEASAGGSMSTTLDDYTNFLAAVMQRKGLKKSSFDEMIKPQIRIKSKQQFGPDAWMDSTSNDNIELSYGFAMGVMKTPYGRAFFKEGHDDGWGHYSIGFPDKGIALIIMTNNDNGESIFKEVLETAIGDKFTPWKWENYIPYNQSK
ncbi:MAG: serine hydrolase, partial [Daejeonella sp.]|nr:serine hydrolase [Daejeonella sp.]